MKNIAILSFVLVLVVAGVANSATTTVTYQVSASGDDGFAQSAAVQDTTSAFLKIGDERTYAIPYQMSGMRFNNVNIPRSATITSAYLKISSINTDYRGQIYGVIAAEASDNPADFSGRMIGNAALTTASVAWDYKTAWSPDIQYISPDISNAIQEVVNRSGFSSGNSIAIYYSTRALSGKARSFASYEYNPASAAVLEVTYETYTISGHILTTEATPLENVTISAGDNIESTVTDSNGYYELIVPSNWSGTVTAKKFKWEITPAGYTYNNLTNDQLNQDFTAFYTGIVNVKPDGTGDYPTIQAAIDAAVNGDVVILQPGTFTGNGNRDIDFKGKAITVRGATGDPNDCIIDCQGTSADKHRGFKFVSGENANSVLDAITIKNGYGPEEDIYGNGVLYSCGGAVFCDSSSPIIDNCVFNNNSARNYGGAVYSYNSNPTLNNCFATGNYASSGGGGLYNYYSSPTIQNCVISGNSTGRSGASRGGGIYNLYSEPVILNCVINDNSTYYNGGGIYNNSSDLIISNCDISNNSVVFDAGGWDGSRGGGIHHESGNLLISNCRINDNTVKGCFSKYFGGGGIYNLGNAIISNSVISNNSVSHNDGCSTIGAFGGGGIRNSGDMLISNCTIVNNLMSDPYMGYGGGIYSTYGSSLFITNSIIWANQSSQIDGFGATVRYSNIQGGYAGVENINMNPLFVDDHHISLDSPCINAGDPDYFPDSNETDIDGYPRIVGTRIDMGADEFATQNPFIVLSETDYSFNALEARENPVPGIVKLNNFGLSALNWTANSNVSWLMITPSSGSLNYEQTETLSITANINGLPAGTYFGHISIEDPQADNSPKIIDVHLTITGPSLEVSQDSFSFQASKETLIPPEQFLTVTNATTGGTLNWSISKPNDCNWLVVNPISGSCTTEPNIVSLNVDVNYVEYGSYNCQLTVSDPNATNSPQVVTVNLEVLRPFISIDPNRFDITACGKTGDVNDILFSIFNAGYDTLNWQIEVPDCNWLTVSPLSGQSVNEPNIVTIAVDTNFVEYGQQSCQLIINAPDAINSPKYVTVNLEVLRPQIGVNRDYFCFTAYGKSDTSVAGQELVITNTGFDTLNWHIEVLDCNWLSIAPQSGQVTDGNSIVALTVDPSKVPAYGYNYAAINIIDENASNSPLAVTARLLVLGPSMYVNPPSLYIYAERNTLVEETFEIRNTGYDILHWNIETPNDCNWLEIVEPLSGECTAGESEGITVTIDTSGLEDNDYHTELLIHSLECPSKLVILSLIVYTPNEIHVPRDYPTIQAAINAALTGDVIIVHPGKYEGFSVGRPALTIQSIEPENPAVVAATIIESMGYVYGSETVIDGLSFIYNPAIYFQSDGIYISYNAQIKNCRILNFPGAGINVSGRSQYPETTITNCVISNNGYIGGYACGGIRVNTSAHIENCLITGNFGGGISVGKVGTFYIYNSTIADNFSDIMQTAGRGITCDYSYFDLILSLRNSVISNAVGPNDVEILINADNPDNINLEIEYSNVTGGSTAVSVPNDVNFVWGPGNLDADPCFAEAGFWHPNDTPLDANDDFWVQGDYHLKSQAGRWKPSIYIGLDPTGDGFIDLSDFAALASFWCEKGGSLPADLDNSGFVDFADLFLLLDNYLTSYSLGAWVFDDVNSPCIDAGDPVSDWTEELWPHGKHINMGAYGGTPQASMSLLTVGNKADLNNDGFVNAEDLALFVEMWLVDDLLLAENINRNGLVNSPDFAEFAGQWLWEE